MHRAALLIRCSASQAERVRARAALERRTISGYLLRILTRRIDFEDLIAQQLAGGQKPAAMSSTGPAPSPGARTALLLRCTAEEAARIRAAAFRRRTTISSFVLHALMTSWNQPQ